MELLTKDIALDPVRIPKLQTYVVGEIGINHNGNIENALQLIDIAVLAGCSCVKFQKRTPELCVPEHQKSVLRDTPWGKMTYLDYRYKVEFGKKEYDRIDEYCRQKGVAWTASIWDLESLKFMKNYKVPFVKVPSAMLMNHALIIEACKNFDDVWVSTGMSLEEEIDQAVDVLRRHAKKFLIMHCNSSYPAHVDELNLRYLETLKKKYDCRIGYSGHEFELITSIVAIVFGAEAIERHITLDRTQWGSDQLASVEPHGLFTLINGLRKVERALGDGKKKLWESEMAVRKKLRG